MAAIYSLCIANLRKKKVHNGLIGLLILLSTLLLATSVTVIMNTSNLFTTMHDRTNGSHEMLLLRDELHDTKQVYQWWSKQQGVRVSQLIPYRMLAGMAKQGQAPSAELSSLTLYMIDAPSRPYPVDELIFAEGTERTTPEKGTIWLPTSIAYLHELKVGDTIGFTTGEKPFALKVSALVVDIPYGAPFATDARIWMNHEDYVQYVKGMQGKEQYMLGLRYGDYAQSADYWDRFEKDMGTPYLESKMSLGEMSSFYLIMNKAIGFIMIFLGVVMMLVALFTIGFTISDDVLSNYKTIGVIKALGLSSQKMISVYVTQYALISLVAILPGLWASSFVSGMIVDNALSSLKSAALQEAQGGSLISLAAGIFVFILVLLCAFVYANRARYVQPMQAIRYGMSEVDNSKMTKRYTSGKSHFLSLGRAPLLVVIGMRNVWKNKKASFLMLLLATIMSAVLVLGFVLLNSISNIRQTSAAWGYDASDISLRVVNTSSFSRAEFDKVIRSDSRVKNMGWLGQINGVVSAEANQNPNAENAHSMNFNIYIVDGSYDEVGYTTIKGRNPRNKNEMSIGISVAKRLQKDVGDVVEVYIDGYKHTLLVSGIFQSISNQSVSARILADTIRVNNPQYNNYLAAFINLNDKRDADRVVAEINAKYKDAATAATMQTLLDATFKQAVASLILPMSIMGLMFIGVTLIIIYSVSRINIRKESKTYGIYKSIGLSSTKIRSAIMMGIVALSAIGAIIGVVLGVYCLPVILGSILSDYGIAELPIILHWGGIAAFACTTILAAALGIWASSRVVATTSPQILVIE